MAPNYVPEEIFRNILTWLPAKPLARFKCVSRNWNHMISDSGFMKSRARRMILLPVHPFQAIDKIVTGDDLAYTMVNLHSPFKRDIFFMGGTFNGLVLLLLRDYAKRDDNMILFNPLTRASKIIPYSYSCRYSVCGFGYGTTPDDLKIVRLSGNINSHDVDSSRYWDVYSLKNGSWSRPSDLIVPHTFHNHSGLFVNGFLYWLAYKRWSRNLIVVAFDVKEMVFSEMEIPDNCSRSKILGTFKGNLCIVSDTGYDLWVMNNYGFWESCLKLRHDTLPIRSKYFNFLKLCILDEGKIVMRNPKTNKIVIFDMLKGSCRDVKTLNSAVGKLWTSQAIEYVESWVSPSDIC